MSTQNEQAQSLDKLIEQRRQKAEALREMGLNPYANGFEPNATATQLIERFGLHKPAEPEGAEKPASKEITPLSEERFALAGRIVEFRSFGKATFIKLADRSGRLQVYVRKDKVGEQAYSAFKKAELWDFVGATGFAFYTKTGELTVMAEQVVVLTKAIRPPPEKWSGLKDQETRYRQRYVDLVANPEVATVFRTRSKIIRMLRNYLDQREFMEVETPILHTTLGGAAARPFTTHHNALDMPLYLRIAPELYLKRCVVGGFDRVYEIGRQFRNEGLSRYHNPEFTMLEFYMAYATDTTLIDMTEHMLSEIAEEVCGTTKITFQGQQIDLSRPWQRISVVDAVVRAGSQLSPPLSEATARSESELAAWCEQSGLAQRQDPLGEALRKATSHGARLAALFDQLGEEHLPTDKPVFVTDYPAATSPLSRRQDGNPEFVDRFELFIAGREVANGFSELNDPIDQRQRFQSQVEQRSAGDEEAMEYDEDYCRALEYGMPPTAGEGIGIDRLVMLLCDQPSIRDVLLFPHMRSET